MREIKFRAKMVDNSQWVYGGGVWTFKRGTALFGEDESGNPIIHSITPETVGQFTGLKDSKGKEIYEGDVFENQSGRGIITWIEEHACLGAVKIGTGERFVLTSKGKTFNTEVIGNIYENPELLPETGMKGK